MLRSCNNSLEKLIIPRGPSPPDVLSMLYYPRLRELTLRGVSSLQKDHNLCIRALMNMPNLCVLKLDIAVPGGHTNWPVRPPSIPFTFNDRSTCTPWPNLKCLSVSFPHPNDELYVHLPRDLRTLSLRSLPHYWHRRIGCSWGSRAMGQMMRRFGWSYPIPTASEALCILQRCRTPGLSQLQLEYRVDDEEIALLRTIVHTFPELDHLEIARYADGQVVPLKEIAEALAPLAKLNTLRVYLDSPESPEAYSRGRHIPRVYRRVDVDSFLDGPLNHAATVFARKLSPSLELVQLLSPGSPSLFWASYRVLRANGAHVGDISVRREDEGQPAHWD
ncbi:hypothetical protein C8Q78DRAFT_5783 [Trametes maxima]|nr:hypothetical protein C8Q78DRAFT_5783 [Trametes maxima]